MAIKVVIDEHEVSVVSDITIKKEMNSAETCTMQLWDFVRIGEYVKILYDDIIIFTGYVNQTRLSFDNMNMEISAISTPILNKIMQTKIKIPASDTSWSTHLMTLLRLCGATLTYSSQVPSLTPERGNQLISESKLYFIQPNFTKREVQGGRGYFVQAYAQPQYDKTGNVVSAPNQPTISYGTMISGEGNYTLNQSESSETVKEEIEVDFKTILKNIEKETGKKLFYTITGNKMYIGVQGSHHTRINEDYVSSAEITEDATEVVESIANINVIYND